MLDRGLTSLAGNGLLADQEFRAAAALNANALDSGHCNSRQAPAGFREQVEPMYFGSETQRLFGVLYRPVGKPVAEPPVLICPPIGHEFVRSYNAVRRLCERLARDGIATFKFDYCGLGDSYGDGPGADVTEWRNNIRMAASELCRRTGRSEITLVGLRLGATLAAGVRAEGVSIENFVLWDPIVCGADFVLELKRLQRACLADTRRFRTPRPEQFDESELLGFSFPAKLRQSLAELTLLNRSFPYENCYLITSSGRPEYEALSQTLATNSRGRSISDCVPERTEWDDHRRVEAALIAHRMIAAIGDKIANGFS